VLFSGFRLVHLDADIRSRDIRPVISVSVKQISFGRGFVLGRTLGDLVSRDLVIGLLKHKPNRIGPFVLKIDLYINNKYLSIYKLLKQ